ncbi:MAG TPA: flagellar assembly protein FliH [Steroidobacteraceae bacterium]
MSEPETTALWQLPQINGPVLARNRRETDLQGIEREAWDKGYAQGHEAGIAAARKQEQAATQEFERRVQSLGAILDFMSKPLAALDAEVQRQLISLTGAIARQIVRRELKTHPDEIVAVIRETVALLPMTAREVRVHLNPEDAKLVRSRLAEASGDRVWSLAEDPIISRGGCRVSSENSSIDAQLEQRIGAAIAAALGDARATPAPDGSP